jgi:hypothetical protein
VRRGARPRMHLLRYFGVLSSHNSLRSEVTPTPSPQSGRFTPPPRRAISLRCPSAPLTTPHPARRAAAAGVGYWRMCFALTSSTVSVVVEPCAGWRPLPLRRPSRGCSPSTASRLDPRQRSLLRACHPDSCALPSWAELLEAGAGPPRRQVTTRPRAGRAAPSARHLCAHSTQFHSQNLARLPS